MIQLKSSNFSWYKNVEKFIKKDYEDYVMNNYKMKIDGSKSLHTNIADFLCYELTYKALKFYQNESDLRLPGIFFSPEQFFWISSAQRYCQVSKDEEKVQKIVLSTYPIESYRANNALRTNDNFARDFNCVLKV